MHLGLLGMTVLVGVALLVEYELARLGREAAASVEAAGTSIAQLDDARVHVAHALGALELAQAGDSTECTDLVESLTALEKWRAARRDTSALASRALIARFVKLATGVPQGAETALDRSHRAADDALASLHRDRESLLAQVSELSVTRHKLQRDITLFHVSLGLYLMILIASLGWTLVSSILRPLESLRTRMARIEAGIDAQPIEVRRDDEIGLILRSFNRLSESLRSRKRDLDTRVRRLEGLSAIVHSASWGRETGAFLQQALVQSIDLIDNDVGLIRLLNPKTERLRLAASKGIEPAYGALELEIEPGCYANGVAYQTGRPIVVEDVLADPRMAPQETARHSGLVSIAAVPIVSCGRNIGSLLVGARKKCRYSAEEIALLETAARIIGSVVEHGRLVEEATERSRNLSTLLDLSRALSGADGFERQGAAALETLARATGADSGAIIAPEPQGGRLVPQSTYGRLLSAAAPRPWPASGDDPVATVLRTQKPRVLASDDQARRCCGLLNGACGMHSCILVPIVHERTSRAVLLLGSTRQAPQLGADLFPLLTSAADQIASAIEAARLAGRWNDAAAKDATPPVDPVTGLPNVGSFRRIAARLVSRVTGGLDVFALLSVEVDGAAASAESARSAACGLREGLRETDVIGRAPDGSFLALLPGADRDVVTGIVDRLRTSTLAAHALAVGVALCPADGSDADRLIDQAQMARLRGVASSPETGSTEMRRAA